MRKLILSLFIAALVAAVPGFGADTKVSADTNASTLDGTEEFHCVQAANDRACSVAQIVTWVETGLNTEAELEALIADMANIIQATEIDTEAELEAIVAGLNFLIETEIDASSELLAIMDDETGTGALTFATSPTLVTPSITTRVTITPTGGTASYPAMTAGVSFTEDGSGTSYIGTVEIPAGSLVLDVCFAVPVLWDGTSQSLSVGDDDDSDGWFDDVDLKAADLVVGEVLCASDDGTWGGKNGVYLTSAGRRGRVTAGIDSGWYYGASAEVIFKVTPGAADGSAGRSFGWVTYSQPVFVASTNS